MYFFFCLGLMQEVNFGGPLQHSISVYRQRLTFVFGGSGSNS